VLRQIGSGESVVCLVRAEQEKREIMGSWGVELGLPSHSGYHKLHVPVYITA